MYSIGQVAKQTDIKIPTIRYYEDIGLLAPPSRSAGNQRRYSQTQLERLMFVKHARQLGFSLEAVASLAELSSHRHTDCSSIDKIAQQHLSQVTQRIKLLKKLQKELNRIVSTCSAGKVTECYVIESLINHSLCIDEHD